MYGMQDNTAPIDLTSTKVLETRFDRVTNTKRRRRQDADGNTFWTEEKEVAVPSDDPAALEIEIKLGNAATVDENGNVNWVEMEILLRKLADKLLFNQYATEIGPLDSVMDLNGNTVLKARLT